MLEIHKTDRRSEGAMKSLLKYYHHILGNNRNTFKTFARQAKSPHRYKTLLIATSYPSTDYLPHSIHGP